MAISRRTVVAGAAAGAAGSAPGVGRRRRRRHAGRAEGPALCLRGRRDEPRSGQDQRPVLAHADAAHLRGPLHLRPPGAAGQDQAAHRRRHAAEFRDFRVWTVKIRPGIFFAQDPAFKGKRRELVAQDYAYSYKRFADPANKSPVWSGMETEGFLGLNELRARALADKKPFDYDSEIDGIRAIDRYTLRFMIKDPRPRFLEGLAASDLYGAVAREVIEFYGDQAEAHPVGTGPFKLAQWRRSSFLAFDRNPDFREMVYDAEPACRRRRRSGAAGALQGTPAADDRSGRDLHHRGGAAALACVRQRRS